MSETDAPDLADRLARLERALESARRRRPDWDAYSAVVASLVALLALMVAGYTAHLQRKQVRASVWPHVSLPASTLDRRLHASNHGVGPARVTGVKVQVGGKTVRTWDEVVRAIGHGEEKYVYGTLNGRVLPAGAQPAIFSARDTDGSRAMLDDFFKNKARFSMIVCYCSVLDECWMTGRGSLPGPIDEEPIDECPIKKDEQFKD